MEQPWCSSIYLSGTVVLFLLLFSPVDDHRATGQVERIIRVLNERLTCKKNNETHKFNLKHDCAEITAALRLVRNRNTGIVQFEMHFGRPPNTVLRNIASKATPENLGYLKVLDYLIELHLGPKKVFLKK